MKIKSISIVIGLLLGMVAFVPMSCSAQPTKNQKVLICLQSVLVVQMAGDRYLQGIPFEDIIPEGYKGTGYEHIARYVYNVKPTDQWDIRAIIDETLVECSQR